MTAQPPAELRPRPESTSQLPPGRSWIRLVDPRQSADGATPRRPPTAARVLGQFVAANLVAVLLLLAVSAWASQRAAEVESLADARTTTEVLATVLVQPAMTDDVTDVVPGDRAALDRVVRSALLDTALVRVKIWAPNGRILYSDEPRLIGTTFPLGADELDALVSGQTDSQVSDLTAPENRYERSNGRLLEVYRRITTPSGKPLLFETYSRYGDATARQVHIWLTFAPISAVVLVLLMLVQLPLGRRMIRQLRNGEQERLRLHALAADASADERRRIAGSLHDGIVQDLAGASFVLAGATEALENPSRSDTSSAEVIGSLKAAGSAVRDSVTALRSLLIEIYPPHLAQAGLPSALRDLATRLLPHDAQLTLEVPDEVDVPPATAALLFRVAQEALINIAKHAFPRTVLLRVTRGADRVTLEVSDDGRGFDPGVASSATGTGHFGLHVLTDLAEAAGATLDLAAAPGAGTALRLEVPVP